MRHGRSPSLTGLLLLVAFAAPALGQDGKSHYVLGLIIGQEKRSSTDGDVLNAATDAFVLARRFTIVERSKLDAVFTEKDLQEFLGKGNNDLSTVLGLDLLGLVNYAVESARDPAAGLIESYVIDVRLVDVKTGQVLTTVSSEREDILRPPATPREAGRHLFQSVRQAFPPVGYVIKLDGEEVVVDLGSDLGVQDGDVLEVVREGEQIIHPVTGEALPAQLIAVGTLKVVSIWPQFASCRAKSGGAEIQLGSIVRLRAEGSRVREGVRKVLRHLPWRDN